MYFASSSALVPSHWRMGGDCANRGTGCSTSWQAELQSEHRLKCVYPLSKLRPVEIMEERGMSADHSSINRWPIRVLPLMETMDRIHKHRVGSNWHISDRRSESRRFVSNATKPSQCHSSRFTFASFLPVEVCRLGNFHFPAPPCLESSDPYRKGFQPTCRSFRGCTRCGYAS